MSMSYTLRTPKGIVTYERTMYDTVHTAIVRNKTSLLYYKNITKTILSTLLSSWWEQLFSKRRVFSFLDESLLKQFLL